MSDPPPPCSPGSSPSAPSPPLRRGDEQWLAETGDTADLVLGRRAPTGSDADEDDWFVVDSWCRQQIWGEWSDGDYQGDLGAINPSAPLTEAYFNACPALVAARP